MSSGLNALGAKSPTEAKTLFESALRTDPQNPALYAQILEACHTNGYWNLMVVFGERAVQACREAPESVRVALYGQLVQGYTRSKCQHWRKLARETAQRAVELQPSDPNTLNLYGYTLVDTFVKNDKVYGDPKDLKKAEQMIVAAMTAIRSASPFGTADPALAVNLAVVEDSYAWLLVKRERYEEAAKLLADVASRIDSDDFGADIKEIYYHLGVAYSRLGREDDARQALNHAIAYDLSFPEANAELRHLPHSSVPAAPKKN